MPKTVFQDLQHNEQGEDQGNSAYGIIYDLWTAEMKSSFPSTCIPNDASKANSSVAENIVESYKMIAEQLLLFHTREITSHASLCIEAARIQLQSFCSGPPEEHSPVYVCFDTSHGYCGCTVWVYNLASVQQVVRSPHSNSGTIYRPIRWE